MKLKLVREHDDSKEHTHGKLFINDVGFCHTLEDKERKVKIKGKTAIPCGTYKVIVSMSARFNQLMPLLLDVPNFTGVRIHSGNTDQDTEGCILVGLYLHDGFITKSRITYIELMKRINSARAKKEDITIEII